jgi:homopolymeric O-antigen transport system ATP-binding protein
MNTSSLVEARAISKKYCRDLKKSLWYGLCDIGKEVSGRIQNAEQLRTGEFWALQNVSFSLNPGDALGLLGRNGAGKTSLLRVLNGVMRPDLGFARVRGEVAPLIELGAGFSPILTGRENIYVNAAILGVSGKVVNGIIDAIVDFAEISDFIDMPVQSYSEGMKARLGFSVAAHLNPAVMLVDEVLAVGDMGFQRKCLKRISHYVSQGGILVFVSHNMHLIQSICQRSLVLDGGQVVFDGPTATAVERYARLNEASKVSSPIGTSTKLTETTPVIIDALSIEPVDASVIGPNGSMRLTLMYRALQDIESVTWGFSLWTHDQEVRIATGVAKYNGHLQQLRVGTGAFSCIVCNLPLVSGTYWVKSGIYDSVTGWPIARFGWENAPVSFEIKGPTNEANSRHRIDNDIVELDISWLS